MINTSKKLYRNYLIALLTAISLVILAAGYFYLDHQRKVARQAKEEFLNSVVLSKTKLVGDWFDKIEYFCSQISENELLNHHVNSYLKNPFSHSEKKALMGIIKVATEHFSIKHVFLCDSKEEKHLPINTSKITFDPQICDFCKEAMVKKQAIFSDFYQNSLTKKPQLSFHVPIFSDIARTKISGIMNIIIDPEDYLYPLILEWPIPSKSGEVFISKHQGNKIVYLTQLKFNRNSALNFTLPDTLQDLPAFKGAHHQEGVFEGRDYRGVEVIAAVKNMEKTGWSFVAKEDTQEIFYESDRIIALLTIIIVGIIPITGLIIGFVWSAREKAVAKKLLIAEKEAAATSIHLANITKYANDIILLIDINGNKIVQANEKAFSTYGYTREELLSMRIDAILSPIERKNIKPRIQRILNTNEGFLVESSHVKKDRSLFPVEISARKLVIEDNVYIQAIIRDITDRKNSEAELRKREVQYRELFNATTDLIQILSPEGKILYVNPAWHNLLGYSEDDIVNLTIDKIIHPDSLAQCQNTLGRAINGEKISHLENRFITKEGKFVDVEGNISCQFDADEPKRITCLLRDVTDRKKAEAQLRNNNEKLRTIFSAMDDIIFVINSEGRFIEIAPTNFGSLYRPVDEVLGKTVFETFPETYAKFFFEKIKESINEQRVVEISYSLPISGKERWFDAKISPIDNESVIIVISDVTDKKRAEIESELQQTISVAISKAEDFNEAVTEVLKNICEKTGWVYGEAWVPDAKSGKLVCLPAHYLNNEKCGIFRAGSTSFTFGFGEGLPGRIWATQSPEWIYDISKADNFPRISLAKDCSINAGVGIPVYSKNIFVAVLCFYVFESKEVDMHFTNLVHAVASQLGNLFLRKQVEDEIYKLNRAIEQSSVSVVITDYDGNIEYVNPFFTHLTGYSFEEVKGKNPRFLRSGVYQTEFYKELWSTILHGNIWRGEMYNKKKTGDTYWALAVISPVTNQEGKITHFIAIEEDITEKKKLFEDLVIAKDKAEEMNRVKSFFFANMSHELRTPMIGILGFSELIKESVQKDEDLHSMAETILTSGNRLLNTLNLILNLSKLESSEVELKLVNIDIIPKLREIFKTYMCMAEKAGLQYNFQSDQHEVFCQVDEKVFGSIFDNLLSNAIKYTPSGTVNLNISVAGDKAIIQVTDTGIGIEKDKQEIVWYEFRQASEGLNRSFEGTGLGLTIAKKYTEALNGNISLQSEKGLGSTFTVEFPLVANDLSLYKKYHDEAAIAAIDLTNLKSRKRDKNILLVDDDPIAVDIVNIILGPIYNIDHAFNGETALQKVKEKKYDAILMDINLRRGIDGVGATQEIRKMENYKETPIIALTAFAMEEDKAEFLSKGMSHYISKPFSKQALLDLMNEVFPSA